MLKNLKNRNPYAHKGDFGKVMVIGGSQNYTGAPILNSLAAYRMGTDIVEIISPRRAADIIASYSPSMITFPLEKDYFRLKDKKAILELIKDSDTLIIGGGIGVSSDTKKLIPSLIKETDISAVVDADAIKSISTKDLKSNLILTPHKKEFEILSGESLEGDSKKDKYVVREFAQKHRVTLLIKGKEDIITDGEKVRINSTGTPFMSKGGTGDILAGIIASLIAQGFSYLDSAYYGAYICGKAGEIISEEKKMGYLPEELVDKIPDVL